jgi:transposase
LDLGKRSIDWCEVSEGAVVGRGRVSNIAELESVVGPQTAPARVGWEACREARHVHDVMRRWGHEPHVFDTTRVRRFAGIGEHGRKNDRIDAEKLALALERGHAPRAHVLSDDARRLRELQELHRALVHGRKRAVVHARGLLQGRGIALASCDIEHFTAHVRKAGLPAETLCIIEPLLAPIEAMQVEIARVDLQIHELCTQQKDPVVERLASVPGVSLLVAAAFISAIDDPARFRSAGQVSSYLGLCPREESTGGRHKLGSITKQGNAYARSMLVQSAWCVLRSRDTKDPLVRWAHQLSQKRGRMRAAVAVARRLARVLWALWQHGTFYDRHEARKFVLDADERQKAVARARKQGELKLSRQRRACERALGARNTTEASTRP